MSKSQIDLGRKKAAAAFTKCAKECSSKDELYGFVSTLAILSLKLIAGEKGVKFRNDFLKAAKRDPEVMTLHRTQ